MNDIIIREGDQITIALEDYMQLKQDNKLLTIFAIILILALTFSLLFNIFKRFDL